MQKQFFNSIDSAVLEMKQENGGVVEKRVSLERFELIKGNVRWQTDEIRSDFSGNYVTFQLLRRNFVLTQDEG